MTVKARVQQRRPQSGSSQAQDRVAVGIIHASPIIGEGISDLLSRQPGIAVVATYESARDVLEQPPHGEHVLLCDLTAIRRDGQALVAELRQQVPQARLLVFGVSDDVESILECVRAGASGCILENISLDDLLAGIRSLARGTPPMSPRVVTTLFSYVAGLQAADDQPPATPLTPREEQVLRLMAEGLSNKEIAGSLHLGPQTVKNYVHQVLQKLNLHSRLDVLRASRDLAGATRSAAREFSLSSARTAVSARRATQGAEPEAEREASQHGERGDR